MPHTIPVNTNTQGDSDKIADGKLLSGEAGTLLWHAFSDASDRFHVGHWASGPCEIDVTYTEDELCVIVEGTVTLTATDGTAVTYEAGQSFVIPSGFEGVWKSHGSVKKIYASFE